MADGLAEAGQRRRIAWLAGVLLAIGLLLTSRLAWWQLMSRPDLISLGIASNRPDVIPAARGNILDSNGHYLVASTVTYKVSVSPRLLSSDQRDELAPQLAAILGKDPARMRDDLDETDTEYLVLGNKLPAAVGEQIQALNSDAIRLEIEFPRVYPDDSLAASVLGFVFHTGEGQYGVERYYDRALTGQPGTWYGVRDAWGQQVLMSRSGYRPAIDGADLVLTIDRNIQDATERILREGIENNRATSGNIVVMDPRTGAILAMANYPTYEPANYGRVASQEQYVNTAVSALYEPGSVFKPLTLAAALETRVIRSTDTYDDRGEILVGNQLIRNSDKRAYGQTTMTGILARSLNVGAAHVATLLGPTRFYEMIRRFGFGQITGVDLAAEERGIMRVPGDAYWHMSDLGTNSYGQGISVTPLQVVAAYGALANDGVLMRPYVVSQVRHADHVEYHDPFRARRVVSEEVAHQITDMMVDAVETGMKEAVVPGYRMAGKSGTAGVPDQQGYENDDVIASFVGYGPLPDPQFVILVRFDQPREGYWGLEVAAPEFRTMAKFLIDYYGIPPQ
jgi:cell division protein FtsI/penicillin-binding protein 2